MNMIQGCPCSIGQSRYSQLNTEQKNDVHIAKKTVAFKLITLPPPKM
jgi:hypothetical protein